jgi:hypothetical protein
MEPLLIILVPGVIGGIVLSMLITRLRRTTPPTFVPKRLEPTSPSLINMSSIKIEGLGGLGMVAAVIAVAIADPRIRLAIIIAAVLGGGLALFLIRARRSSGGLHSGDDPDGDSLLHLESHRPTGETTGEDLNNLHCHTAFVI